MSPPVEPSVEVSHTLNDGHYSVSFTQADRDNPHNWSVWKKTWVVLISVVLVLNSTMSTSISALGSSQITRYFHQNHEVDSTLPTSIYLAGYVFGSLIFSPLSEQYGRRIISLLTFYLYSIFVVACALAPSFSALLFFRFCAGLNASSPMSVTGGVFADVFHEPRARGRIMALYMVVTIFGPLLGSIIDAYVSSDSSSWRWTYWTTAIIAGCTAVGVAFQPESFAPVVLQRKAKRLRKERKDPRYIALSDTSSQTFQEIAVVVLTRPVRMIFTEPVCFFVCLYLGLIYAIFYIQFQSYSLIFKGVYGFNVEQLSLTLLPISTGAIASGAIYMVWDHILASATRTSHSIARLEEYRRLPLACIGGPLFTASIFWIGTTARSDIHWAVPMSAGFVFGAGYVLIFMALLNYLVDAYKTYAASAIATSASTRNLIRCLLPLSAQSMYATMGLRWGSFFLGFLSLLMCLVPFAFMRFGRRIRESSPFCKLVAGVDTSDEDA